MLDQHVVFLDLETTGATATRDRITEIGLVEVDCGRHVGEWSTLVNPGMHIPGMIQALTGITDDMVALAPAFEEVCFDLFRRLDGKVLVAHNARFDYAFLKNEFRRAGLRYNARAVCTVKLSRRLYPEHRKHNLDALMERHGVVCTARHRALGDARVLWDLTQCWERDVGRDVLCGAVATLLKAPSVPSGLPDGVYDDLPETPGVYLFYGDNDAVLYVGKSVNLRSRVMSHFSGDHRLSVDLRMSQEVKRIDWRETAGELGALILEAKLVKELAPIHNRQLRQASGLVAWHWSPDEFTAPPQLVGVDDVPPGGFSHLHGLFRSRAAALSALREMATAHELCYVLLGLEKRKGACFARQLKRCRGACTGDEPASAHALRLAEALARLTVARWPYGGPIAVREGDGERTELHVIDRWCYLGTARTEAEVHELAHTPRSPRFDLDTYKILTKFLRPGQPDPHVVRIGTA